MGFSENLSLFSQIGNLFSMQELSTPRNMLLGEMISLFSLISESLDYPRTLFDPALFLTLCRLLDPIRISANQNPAKLTFLFLLVYHTRMKKFSFINFPEEKFQPNGRFGHRFSTWETLALRLLSFFLSFLAIAAFGSFIFIFIAYKRKLAWWEAYQRDHVTVLQV